MRRQVKKSRSTKSAHRLSITGVVIVLAILAVGAVTVVSRQKLSAKATIETKSELLIKASRYDAEALKVSQEDADKLAGGLKQMINQSTDGLTEVHHSDGSVSLNLEDRFQNVTVAKVTNNRLSQSCVDNPQAAGAFFNIDPKLFDNKARAHVTPITKQ